MSLRGSLRLTLLCVTLTMVLGYTWLMEANIASGLLLGSEIRLNRTADALIDSNADLSLLEYHIQENQSVEIRIPPADGTPIVYSHKESLPLAVQEYLPEELIDGQFTIIETEELGFLNIGYLLHLFRTLPKGEGLHIVQRLVLAEHEVERVQDFDTLMNKRALLPGAFFILTSIVVVLLFGHLVTKATTRLLHWCENISIHMLPGEAPKLPFTEMQRIAEGTLATVQRESEAIEHRHRFLRFASHELRTPLAIASANTELLTRHGVDSGGMNALARLEESLTNMRGLTDALLWLGRGEFPLPDSEPVDLLCLVNNIIDENSTTAKSNNVKVVVNQTSNKPIVYPRVLLMILCSNLISNAIHYTRDGRVDIRLSEEIIEIENYGHLTGDKVGNNGHGLGLQLVKWVVERTGWQWDEAGDAMFRRHRIHLAVTKR